MYRISVIDYFSSAHQLKGYKGKCEHIHGHNWKVEIEVESKNLNEIGLLIDFGDLKQMLGRILSELDHKILNEVDEFLAQNPSSELIARYIYRMVKEKLPAGIRLISSTVWESERSKAMYFEEI